MAKRGIDGRPARPENQYTLMRCKRQQWPDSEAPTSGPAGPLPEIDLPCRRSEWHGSVDPKETFRCAEQSATRGCTKPASAATSLPKDVTTTAPGTRPRP